MKENLFTFLLWNNPKTSAHSEEQIYFDTHAYLFNEKTNIYNDNSSLFGLIQACIVLHSASNKEELDSLPLKFSKDVVSIPQLKSSAFNRLTYAEIDGERIYIPTYGRKLNAIYREHLESLVDGEYSIVLKDSKEAVVDPFEEYSLAIYDSPFTRLMKLDATIDGCYGFYHSQFETLFIVDSSGALLEEIPLFDEKCVDQDKEHLFLRLNQLFESYFSKDSSLFVENLRKLNFISDSLYQDILEFEEKRRKKQARKGRK